MHPACLVDCFLEYSLEIQRDFWAAILNFEKITDLEKALFTFFQQYVLNYYKHYIYIYKCILKSILSNNTEHLPAFQTTEEFEKTAAGSDSLFLCTHLYCFRHNLKNLSFTSAWKRSEAVSFAQYSKVLFLRKFIKYGNYLRKT